MAIIDGNGARNILLGTLQNDIISGFGGDDVIEANAGFDTVFAGAGEDIVFGGENSDLIFGGDGSDILAGGTSGDTIYGDTGGGGGTADTTPVTTSNTVVIPSSQQDFSVSLTAPDESTASSYKISGFVSTTPVVGNDVNIALVVDVSGSTGSYYSGTSVGDLNGDGYSDTILDGEIAGSLALINSVIAAGFGHAMINLITFDDAVESSVTMRADADTNNNGILDLEEALRGLNDSGGTNFEPPLQEAINFFNARPAGGSNYVFFLSDGYPYPSTNFQDEAATLYDANGINATIRTFPIGSGASVTSLDEMDDGQVNNSTTRVTDPGALSASITGGGIDPADVLEVRVFVNGVLEQTIPSAQLIATPFGLKYEVDLTGLSTTNPENIRVVAVANDTARTIVATNQVVENPVSGGDDVIFGGVGSDFLYGESGDDAIFGGMGSDLLEGGAGYDTLFAGEGNDTVKGGFLADLIYGLVGDDSLLGEGGNDEIHGGYGADTMDGGNGNDTIVAGDGRDIAYLGDGNDVFFDNNQGGILGQDTVFGGNGADTINGGGGNDQFDGGVGADKLFGWAGNDLLTGGDGADTLDGGGGNDTVFGGNGQDIAYLGAGNDRFFDNTQGGVLGQDTVFAGDGNDTITGGAGNDRFYGGNGNDVIYGRTGNDVMTGGLNADTFVFEAGFGQDTITDFYVPADTLRLEDGLWGGGLTALQVVNTYASLVGGDVVFTFGSNTITLDGVNTLAGLDTTLDFF